MVHLTNFKMSYSAYGYVIKMYIIHEMYIKISCNKTQEVSINAKIKRSVLQASA